ncbi:MAG: hypothetical protein NTY19_43230 [Planctomycetota bacterium]|nr:hypothetical protein [Planctomycetota bacterium]
MCNWCRERNRRDPRHQHHDNQNAAPIESKYNSHGRVARPWEGNAWRLSLAARLPSLGYCGYLRLLDWTRRQARPDKRGQIPGELAPILERLQLSAETWVDTVLNFGHWFKRVAGRAESLTVEAARRDRHWLHGLARSRAAFG